MRVVTGVVGNDIHVVANRLIEISLKERGFEVFNLGVNTYLEEFIDAVIETDADVLLISSLNGEAEGWSRDLLFLKSRFDLDGVLFAIGGNLSVGEANAKEMTQKYRAYGYDLVFHQIDLNEGLDMIEQTLKERN
ncbi:MAG TPA: methylaspartate mutase subunit S [Campylobacterales bacterium]|nr:methylaspartate mutase subunit S [Campylobacterales bacterium]HHD80112.1 methylaspartate mutase subunit S [Campylobacterales bacterium]